MPESSARQRLWAALAAATVLNLPLGSLYAYSVLLKPFEAQLGATRSELAAVFALATISFTIGMNGVPRLFARFSAVTLLVACVLAAAGGVLLAAYSRSITGLAIGYGVLFGLGGGAAYIVVQQGINIMLRARKGLVNGYIVSLYPLGAMVSAPLMGLSLASLGLRDTLIGLALVLALTGLVAIGLVILSGAVLHAQPDTQDSAAMELTEDRSSIFWKIFLAFFLAAAAGLMVLSQAAGIVSAYGGSRSLALYATTAITGAIAAARLGGGWLVDRFAVPAVMAAAHVLALSGTVLLTIWPGPVVSVLGLAMIGMGYGFISGSVAGAIAFFWPGGDYGRIASRLYIAWCVAAISLPVLAGHLYDLTGGYRMAMIIAGCGNMLGIMISLLLPRQRRTIAPAV